MKYIVISTTTNKKVIADNISNTLLKKKLSPCVQIKSNIISNYIWNDKIKTDEEFSVQIKSILKFKNEIIDIIIKLHNYDIPEIISNDIYILNNHYKTWYKECLKK